MNTDFCHFFNVQANHTLLHSIAVLIPFIVVLTHSIFSSFQWFLCTFLWSRLHASYVTDSSWSTIKGLRTITNMHMHLYTITMPSNLDVVVFPKMKKKQKKNMHNG